MTATRRRRAPAVLAVVAVTTAGLGPFGTACAHSEETTEVRAAVDRQYASSRAAHYAAGPVADLGGAMLAAMTTGHDANMVISPTLAAQQLATIRLGAAGDSATALDGLLTGYEGDLRPVSSTDVLINARSGPRRSEHGRGSIALGQTTGLWLQEGHEVSEAYLELLGGHLGTGVQMADFRSDPETARREIDAWASEAGAAEETLPGGRVTPATSLLSVAVGWIEAPWDRPFDVSRTSSDTFHAPSGPVEVPMMSLMSATGLSYGDSPNWRAVEIPYIGGDLALLIVIPRRGDLRHLIGSFDHALLTEIRDSLTEQPVDLALPRMDLGGHVSLRGAFGALGAEEVFSTRDGDLSGLVPSEPVALTDVIQVVDFAVDEQGSRGSAAVLHRAEHMPTTGVADIQVQRPFLFAVIDRPSGLMVLLGSVSDPSA